MTDSPEFQEAMRLMKEVGPIKSIQITSDCWTCPECGANAYTHKSQGVRMLECSSLKHAGLLVWMRRMTQGEMDRGES